MQYLSSSGDAANTGSGFTADNNITVGGSSYALSATTVTAAAGGAPRESIESIRFNAPVAFSAQQRLVTADDYKSLILSKFSTVDDCIAWGGEENFPNPEYGKVFVSLKFPDNYSETAKTTIKNQIQTNLIEPLSVISITTEFVDPTSTFLECETFFRFNPNRTNITLKTAENNVQTIINNYFTDNLNVFGEPFRRSNVLTQIDNISDAILNSRMNIKVQQRITPTLGTSATYTLSYPVALAVPDDVNHIVTSNQFTFNNSICTLRNKLNSTTLEIIDADGNIQQNDIGSYNPNTGVVSITGFAPTSISGGVDYIRISITPANQSTIIPLRNYVLNIDTSRSFASGIVDYGKTQVAL